MNEAPSVDRRLAMDAAPASTGPTAAPTSTGPTIRRDAILWGLFLALDSGTQFAFKAGGNALAGVEFSTAWLERFLVTPAIWLGITGYVLAFVLWIAILQGSELARAFTLQGATFVTVPLGGWLLFSEQISLARATGIALIIVGVTLISRRRSAV
jgi:multidrug transporter EmrE-like cation transporter